MVVKVRAQEISLVFQRLATLFGAGISLYEAVYFLERSETNPHLRKALDEVASGLSKGKGLSECLACRRDIFPRYAVELLSVSEQTGRLNVALERISSLTEQSMERTHRLRAALAYPACLALVMVLVLYLFVTFVSPGDSGLFAALGDDVPWPSQLLIYASTLLTDPWWLTVAGVGTGLLVLLLRRKLLTERAFRRRVDTLVLALPLVGPLVIKTELARSLDVISSSIYVGASLVSGLRGAVRVVKNERFREEMRIVSRRVEQGETLGAAFGGIPGAPRYVSALLEVADFSGSLEPTVRCIAQSLEQEVSCDLDQAVRLVEPALLLISGTVAGFITIATFLPVIRLVATY